MLSGAPVFTYVSHGDWTTVRVSMETAFANLSQTNICIVLFVLFVLGVIALLIRRASAQ